MNDDGMKTLKSLLEIEQEKYDSAVAREMADKTYLLFEEQTRKLQIRNAYENGYQQGRADAIDEFCHWYFDMKNDAQINAVDDLIKRFNAEQLKEQKND